MATFYYIPNDKLIDAVHCEHIPEVSSYNYNIYKLERPIEGLDLSTGDFIYTKKYKDHLDELVLLEEADDEDEACYTVGYLESAKKGKFKGKPHFCGVKLIMTKYGCYQKTEDVMHK